MSDAVCARPRRPGLLAANAITAAATVALAVVSACGPKADPCAGVDCGTGGRCLVVGDVPRCECSTGFHAVGSRCEPIADAGLPVCGDGTRNATEICDGEDLGGRTCQSFMTNAGGTLSCATDCQRFDLSECTQVCGDGVASGTEPCDRQDLLGATCEAAGFHPGAVTCTETCELSLSGCGGRCGDALVQTAFGESCDGTDLGGATCTDMGFYDGTLACDSACAWDTSGCFSSCGDGVIQSAFGELCDGDELSGASCVGLGYLGGILACAPDCQVYDVSACETNCGDGTLDFGEVCDDGNQIDADGCSADCREALGRIVFVSNASGAYELWSMLDDGGDLRQLTFGAPDSTQCGGAHAPRFSRDGALIAFRYGGDAMACGGASSAIHVITADGTALEPSPILTATMGGGLSFTRDARAIVYTAGTDRTLRVVDIDGTGDASFFDDVHQERDPDAHPSLGRWAFSAFSTGGEYPGIFVLEGGVASSVVDECTACDQVCPRWSANGDRILFHRNQSAFALFLSSGLESLILSNRVGPAVAWAGEARIVYQDNDNPSDPNIALVSIDGSDRVTLTSHTGYDGQPDWHPGRRDLDLDGVLDHLDNCPALSNPHQEDLDGDGVGDACGP